MKPFLEINNLSYKYPDGIQALKDISLTLCEGESLGIIGANGAGKSTLLLHLNGILRGQGTVKIDGLEVSTQHLKTIRKCVGIVFQNPDHQLFMPTVCEDVAFGPANMGLSAEEIAQQVDHSLALVDMTAAKHRSSHHISVGEKKRIALACVLAMNPKILVLDEPSSNLDPKHRWELIELLQNLKITKIVASHDLELVGALCNKVAILNKGELKAFGSATEILSNKNKLCENDLAKRIKRDGSV